MPKLTQLIPDSGTLNALTAEEVAFKLLQAAEDAAQNGMFTELDVIGDTALFGLQHGPPQSGQFYNRAKSGQIMEVLREAWYWLEKNMLIMPATGTNGANGWRVFTRAGRSLLQNPANFSDYSRASKFPKELIHPAFREAVWLELARGDYDAAVFKAFRAVEIAVRDAGGYGAAMIGVDLMRNALSPGKGPLAKTSDHKGEQTGLMELFTGAMGTFKNPQSHRTVGLGDPIAAQQMVAYASWLMSVVESRKSP